MLALRGRTVSRAGVLGVPRTPRGEVVFNTAITGYQETHGSVLRRTDRGAHQSPDRELWRQAYDQEAARPYIEV